MKTTVLLSIVFLCCFSCNYKRIYSTHTIRQLNKKEYLAKLDSCSGSCLLIDVRTGHEYRKAHLPNAVNISYLSGNFYRQVKTLDTAKAVFIYCQTAHRSPLATKKLKKAGFKKIYDLEGGYSTLP